MSILIIIVIFIIFVLLPTVTTNNQQKLQKSITCITKKGSECLQSIKAAAESLSNGDAKLAVQHLANVDALLPSILSSIQSFISTCQLGQARLGREVNNVQQQISELYPQQIQLMDQKRNLQARINQNTNEIIQLDSSRRQRECELNNARSSLSYAREQLARARIQRDNTGAGAILSGLGAGVLGVVFPPSLFVTVPLTAGIAAYCVELYNQIARLDGESDSLQRNISSIQGQISALRNSIHSQEQNNEQISSDLNNLNQEIQNLKRKQQSLEGKQRENCRTDKFMHEAHQYFRALQQITQNGKSEKLSCLISSLSGKQELIKKLKFRQGFLDSWQKFEDQLKTGRKKHLFGVEMYNS